MPRKQRLEQKKDDSQNLKHVTLQTVNIYTQGFLLVNENEELQVTSSEELFHMLGCSDQALVKVVSIFGNTGDGKSFTLNHTFFEGQEVFHTSDTQQSCTIGVWAAYHKGTNVVTIDTEGLLGTSSNENKRMRLLLKILAISDVVIYRTRAERLGRDMFQFLGDASKAFAKHFAKELESAMSKFGKRTGGLSSLGPAVIVFHETLHTKPLGEDTAVRSPRSPSVVFQALKVLNEKFSGQITDRLPATFPDEYFTCPQKCLSCDARCSHTMNHSEKQGHRAETLCKYQHQFDNKVFLCMACSDKDGMKREVVPKTCSAADSSWFGLVKYAWSGYVLECPKCGIIYRSRERWYGNEEPNVTAVRSEIRHIWPGDNIVLQGTHNAARKLVDGISSVVDTISTVGAKPTKGCRKCGKRFSESEEPIHHCRSCGEGVCDDCSQGKMPVPERGWGDAPVRVCDICYENKTRAGGMVSGDDQVVTARKVGEVMQTTINTLGTAVSYPLAYMVDVSRPAYWIPDHEIHSCLCCREIFGPKLRIHHCRLCGQGVCDPCSQKRRPVPSRGWDTPVRVCNVCDKKEDPL
ncbi:putative zinc finger FYVE domain-containing protein 1-like [Apostichopus japonicus]|uniref:Putative zinc finger FYVE domain-containing protein 1-like n=1 Tax=Stichopus japonicus TaxID=307972 RepID=A0A2G8KKC2_STIJA|nr:putative zinc finger FYVE domain-containing protein 1-like [Apostichopus japonicus]